MKPFPKGYKPVSPPPEVLARVDPELLAWCHTLAIALSVAHEGENIIHARQVAEALAVTAGLAANHSETHGLGVVNIVNQTDQTASVTIITQPHDKEIHSVQDVIDYFEANKDTKETKKVDPMMN